MKTDYLKKIKTNVLGFDYLLFDGLDLTMPRTVIVIQGDHTTERTLFGLQLLYGIGQSLLERGCSLKEGPFLQYMSNYQSHMFINDLLLDNIISSCICRMTELSVSVQNWTQLSNGFSSEFFTKDRIVCQNTCADFYERLPLTDIEDRTDELICREAIYYNNRTNALHFRSYYSPKTDDVAEPLEGYIKSDDDNILYERKYDSISQYVYDNILDFSINKRIKQLGEMLSYPFVGVEVIQTPLPQDNCWSKKRVTVVDVSDLCAENYCGIIHKIDQFRKESDDDPKVLILILPTTMKIPEHLSDMHIMMRNQLENGYQISSLSIRKSQRQACTLGWHQYKRRDYGIEVYPSIHNYFAERRYLQRAMVYTHSDVITDTYQQYLDRNRFLGLKNIVYENFEKDREKMKEDYLKVLYPQDNTGDDFIDILGRIFLADEQYIREHHQSLHNPNDVKDLIYGYRGGVTAIIGDSNTYKRFITFGSAFSSSLCKEHTLFLLLNKEDTMIRRRLACPAWAGKKEQCEKCKQCYSYLHFMNIYMGNITPDELIYFFQKQLNVGFRDGKKIKRVIIDDLEIIDYCFPLLKQNKLFLSALASVCRERNIALYILCDKQGSLVKELRAVADNTICTGRDEKGKSLIYVEKFAGYSNTPSKIYCGKIQTVKDLFLCYDMMDSIEHQASYFSFNTQTVDDFNVSTMNEYWLCNKKN